MKKIILALFISFLFISTGYSATPATFQGKTFMCDQVFESRKLRLGGNYTFYDDFVNTGNVNAYFTKFRVELDGPEDILKLPQFTWTDWIKGKKGIVNVGERGQMISGNGTIERYPQKREKDNLLLRYTFTFRGHNGQPFGPEIEHTECQPYEITWCGDGVLDREFDETCDPKDPTKTGWGTGGCDERTCKPIVKPSTCDLLRANPTTGIDTLTTNFTCEGTNATNFKIDIKNGANIINTINGKTGSFTFTNPGTYVATCFADDKTSASCEQVITVKPRPEGKCINLEVSKVNVEKGQTATFTCSAENTNNYKIKIVNDKGITVKEIFGKTGDFTFPEKGTYVASCYVDDKKTTENTCVKPITVTEPIIPRIDVDKTDKNPLDKDGIQENDTQTIDVKDPAVFKITVTNNGTEELKEIFLKDDVIESDVDAPKCDKSIEEVNQILQVKFGRTTFKPGESFEYTCDRANEARDPETYTNKITVEGKGVISLKGVKDEDPTKVNKSKDPKIKVDKTDKNPADTDGAQENDTQTITRNGTAIFKITVTNNGTEDLKNVFLKDDVLKSDIDAPNCDKSIDEVNNILKTIGNRDIILNIGESFDYTCERKNVNSDVFPYTNKIDVTGTGVTSNKVVIDDDPTVVKVNEEPGINVDKTDKNPADKDRIQENDTQTIDFSDPAVFKITVRNNGTEDLEKIYLVDDVLNNDIDAPKCNKSIEEVNKILQDKFGRTVLKPGESFEYTCDRINNEKDSEQYTNKITVFGVSVTGTPVKDDDPTTVKKPKDPKIKVNKTDKNPEDKDGTQENDTQTLKDKNSKAVFKITVTNNGTEDLKDVSLVDDVLNNAIDAPQCDKSIEQVNEILKTIGNRDTIFNVGESFDYTCERPANSGDVYPYTNEIKVTGTGVTSGKKVEDKDPTVVRVEDRPTPPPLTQCTSISPKDTIKVINFPFKQDFTCTGVGNGDYELYVNGNRVLQNSTGKFTYTFDNRGTYNVECKIAGIGNGNGSCQTIVEPTNQPTPQPTPKDYCGDGQLQRPSKNNPNGNGNEIVWEECDLGSRNGQSGSWCSSECKLADPLTYPGEMGFSFYPQVVKVVGKNMKVYESYKDAIPYIKNNNTKEGALKVEQICVTNKSNKSNGGFIKGTSFDKNTYCSEPVDANGRVVKEFNPGTTLYMKDTAGLRNFIAKTIEKNSSKNPNATKSFEDNVLVTTIVTGSESEAKNGGGIDKPIYQDTRYLSSYNKFIVRVAEGSVATTGGGVSYLHQENNKGITKFSDVTKDFKDGDTNLKVTDANNSHFVGASLTNFLTSYSKQISSGNAVTKAENEANKNNNNSAYTTTTNGTKTLNSLDNLKNELVEYKGITGAYVIKDQNLKVGKINYTGNQPITIIVENGNLEISDDIVSSANIAFVVKGGDINFKSNVKTAHGTYVTIKYGSKGGNIKSEPTANQLVVTGALYGNISDLTTNRTYLKVNDNGQLDTGTVVNYGSNAFRKPAPVLGSFIQEYMNSTKVAQ